MTKRYAHIHTNTHKYTHTYTQIHQNTLKCTYIHANTHKYTKITVQNMRASENTKKGNGHENKEQVNKIREKMG